MYPLPTYVCRPIDPLIQLNDQIIVKELTLRPLLFGYQILIRLIHLLISHSVYIILIAMIFYPGTKVTQE